MRAATGKERLDWELVWLMLKQENMSCNKQAQLQNREFLGLRRQRRTEWLRITAPQKFPECVCVWVSEWVSERVKGTHFSAPPPLTHTHTHVTHTHGKATSIFSQQQASQCFLSLLPTIHTDTPIHDILLDVTNIVTIIIYLFIIIIIIHSSRE